jgi:hypothetical protein
MKEETTYGDYKTYAYSLRDMGIDPKQIDAMIRSGNAWGELDHPSEFKKKGLSTRHKAETSAPEAKLDMRYLLIG